MSCQIAPLSIFSFIRFRIYPTSCRNFQKTIAQIRNKQREGNKSKTNQPSGYQLRLRRGPVAYELYSGDTYEGHTLADGIKKLQQKYKIGKVVLVADSGMLNKDNLLTITDKGYEFIVGERLKNLPKKLQTELLDRKNYKSMSLEKHGKIAEKITLLYHIVEHKGRKILCTYSEKRAKKDRIERETKIEKAQKMMKNPAQLGKKAAIYHLKSNQVDTDTGEVADPKTTKIVYELDQNRIDAAAQYDGLKAIATSDKTSVLVLTVDDDVDESDFDSRGFVLSADEIGEIIVF